MAGRSGDRGRIGRGAVRGIGQTIRFGFVLYIDIGCILVADSTQFLGRNQACRPTVRCGCEEVAA